MCAFFVRSGKRQRGVAAVEFALAALPVLLCALLVVEAARWHMTRQMLNLALLEAARAGAVAHGRRDVMERAFEQALLPLFEPSGEHGDAQAHMRATFLQVGRETGVLPWNIEVMSPTAMAYADFGDAGLNVAGARGLPIINNDYQAEQHARRVRMGWREGRGPLSGVTIFEANTLRLRLGYIHPPLVPGIRHLLSGIAVMQGSRDAGSLASMLTMRMEVEIPMQSHPVHWRAERSFGLSAPSARRGTRGYSSIASIALPRPERESGGRFDSGFEGGASTASLPRRDDESAWANVSHGPGNDSGPVDHTVGELRDSACGIVLCCGDG